MKRYLIVVISFGLCLLFNNKVVAQSVVEQAVETLKIDANQQIQDLIERSIARWQSEGYTVVTYTEFKTSPNSFPREIEARFQENLVRYANKEFGGEHNSFVIYKRDNFYNTLYILQVIEDCPSNIIPNKFTQADTYSMRD